MTTYRMSVMQTLVRVAHVELVARSMEEAVSLAPTLAEENGDWFVDVVEEESTVDSSKYVEAHP